jgi:hypothetical protein
MTTIGRNLKYVALVLLAAVPVILSLAHGARTGTAERPDPDGNAASGIARTPPTPNVQAAFTERSYAPGTTAILQLRGSASGLKLQVYRAGAGHHGPLQGAPVTSLTTLAGGGQSTPVQIGAWGTGLYYACVTTPGQGVWYAPFVLRPSGVGKHRVLVVLPTNTWQAYNFEDDNSWYKDASVQTVDLTRPYIDGGVPPHYKGYDRGFLRWLTLRHKRADFFSDDDLEQVSSGDVLANAYDLIVFPGHQEYVAEHAYDVIRRYRDLGGNLALLSANGFFYKVVKRGNLMDGRWRWRDIGRPEAPLMGAEYVDWYQDTYANKPFTVTGVKHTPWLFRGTGLKDGDTFGVYGIEINATASDSPAGTRVLAHIPGIFGRGKTAQMTYYTTPRGAKVFSAGVMNFGGSSLWPVVSTMMENLWQELGRP